MSAPFRCSVGGEPVPFSRPKSGQGRRFNGASYRVWRRRATQAFAATRAGSEPVRGPVSIVLVVVSPRPASRPDHVLAEDWATGELVWRIGRSDLDNHVKAVLDALVDAGVVQDDRVVAHIDARQAYAEEWGEPGVEVLVATLPKDWTRAPLVPAALEAVSP